MKKILLALFMGCSLFAFSQPTISSFSPTTGIVGATVTITGTNFNTTAANNVVYFGAAKAATPSSASGTSLTVTVPTGATYGPITVLNTGTGLSVISAAFFGPYHSPSKSSITYSNDFDSRYDINPGGSSVWLWTTQVADFDLDGKVDVVVSDYNHSTAGLYVYPNSSTSGTLSFGTVVNLDLQSAGCRGLTVADMDLDGKMDIIAAYTASNKVSIFRNTSTSGTISFATKTDYTLANTGAYDLAIGDLDSDGKPDMIISNPTSICYFLNASTSGSLSFGARADITAPTSMIALKVGDMNGDGLVDIVTANQNSTNSLTVFRNTTTTPGSPTFASSVSFASGSSNTDHLNLCDADGDGLLDAFTGNQNSQTLSVFHNTSSGSTVSFDTHSDYSIGWLPGELGFGDVTGDGKPDVIVPRGTLVRIYKNSSTSGTITLTSQDDGSALSGVAAASVADIDGDGKLDIISASDHGGGNNRVSIWRNNPQVYYSKSGSTNPGSASSWNRKTDGSGSDASNLTSNTSYIIQSGHTMTTTGTVSFGTSGSNLVVQGTLNIGHQITFASGSKLQVSSGGICNTTATQSLNDINMEGGKLNISAGTTLTLNGSVTTTSGVFGGSPTSDLTIGTSVGTLAFDQSSDGSTNVIRNLTIGTGSTASMALGSALKIAATGKISFNASGTKTLTTTGQNLTLLSTASGTAMIDNTNSATITGNIIAERYIPANGRKWRFLASPVVGGTTLQWRDNAGNTANRGISITGSSGTVDASTNNNNSAFYYDEDDATGGTDIDHTTKWDFIDGNSSLTNGMGYRVYVRGDRTKVDVSTNNATTIWVQGTYPASSVSPSISYTAGAGQGWNLVGNPYPCTIDWTLIDGADRTNIDNAVYTWCPSNTTTSGGGYASYVNGTGSGTPTNGTRYISSGQGFFIKANASSPSLTIREADKASTEAGGTLFKNNLKPNSLRIKLFDATEQTDDAVLYFEEGASKNFDSKFDAYDLTEGIGFITEDGSQTLAISGVPELKLNEKVKLNAILASGDYKLTFTDLSSFGTLPEMYLIDKFMNTNTRITDNRVYNFNVDESNPLTFGNNRFELVFGKTATDVEELLNAQSEALFGMYPNPAKDMLNIGLGKSVTGFEWTILDVSGKTVKTGSSLTQVATIDLTELAAGTYFVEVKTPTAKQVQQFVK